jgi:hypothetical protein
MEHITCDLPVRRIAHLMLISSLIVTTLVAVFVHRTSRSSSLQDADSAPIRTAAAADPSGAQGESLSAFVMLIEVNRRQI